MQKLILPVTAVSANRGAAHLQDLDVYLNNVENYVLKFHAVPEKIQGSGLLIKLLQNGAPNQIDAVAQTVRVIAEQPQVFSPGKVRRFEPRLAENAAGEIATDVEIKNVGDILVQLTGAYKHFELKSYGLDKSNFFSIPSFSSSTQFYAQFKAYLLNKEVKELSNLEYIFDQRKLLKQYFEKALKDDPSALAKYFDVAADAENALKLQFQKIFRNNAEELFKAIVPRSKFRRLFNNARDVEEFLEEVDDLNSPIYNFIKVY